MALPLALAAFLALFLFAAGRFSWLNGLSANADNPFAGYDYFGLPRCGLAVRNGTSPFSAATDYPGYGPWATGWVSHPGLCWILGAPLSFLPPWVGYRLMTGFYLALHLWLLWAFGRRLLPSPRRPSDFLFFASAGFFFPWYPMYHYAQYHAVTVFALALVLARPSLSALGFILSGIGKPVLVPCMVLLAARKRWRTFGIAVAGILLGSLPWLLSSGFSSVSTFLADASLNTRFSVFRWNQQISLSAALDELLPASIHYFIRLGLAAASILAALFALRRSALETALALSALWFFFLYARGHEYHLTLYLPILLYLYTGARGRYRGWPLAFLALLLAIPTTYPLFKLLYGPGDPTFYSNARMLELNPWLYGAFLWHKPLCAFFLFGLLFWKERSRPTSRLNPGRTF